MTGSGYFQIINKLIQLGIKYIYTQLKFICIESVYVNGL